MLHGGTADGHSTMVFVSGSMGGGASCVGRSFTAQHIHAAAVRVPPHINSVHGCLGLSCMAINVHAEFVHARGTPAQLSLTGVDTVDGHSSLCLIDYGRQFVVSPLFREYVSTSTPMVMCETKQPGNCGIGGISFDSSSDVEKQGLMHHAQFICK